MDLERLLNAGASLVGEELKEFLRIASDEAEEMGDMDIAQGLRLMALYGRKPRWGKGSKQWLYTIADRLFGIEVPAGERRIQLFWDTPEATPLLPKENDDIDPSELRGRGWYSFHDTFGKAVIRLAKVLGPAGHAPFEPFVG